jgi:ATP-dependent DNA helicase RecQ
VSETSNRVDRTYGILLGGDEDEAIHRRFIEQAFPSFELARVLLAELMTRQHMTVDWMVQRFKVSMRAIETLCSYLELENAVQFNRDQRIVRAGAGTQSWKPNHEWVIEYQRIHHLELDRMRLYLAEQGCLMEHLVRALGDPDAHACGICANCQGRRLRA